MSIDRFLARTNFKRGNSLKELTYQIEIFKHEIWAPIHWFQSDDLEKATEQLEEYCVTPVYIDYKFRLTQVTREVIINEQI